MKKGFVLSFSLMLMLIMSMILSVLLTRSSSTNRILYENTVLQKSRVEAGNVFFTLLPYLQRRYFQKGNMNLSTYDEFVYSSISPDWYDSFLKQFNTSSLEDRSWLDFFGEFKNNVFYYPLPDLKKAMSIVADDSDVEFVLLPRKYGTTHLAIISINCNGIRSYCWGGISSRYFSNWSRFELQSSGNSTWHPGSVIYGPTFFGGDGLRTTAYLPPDPSNPNNTGTLFTGEVWYTDHDLNLSNNSNGYPGRRNILLDTDGNGSGDEIMYWKNNYHYIKAENIYYLYNDNMREMIAAEEFDPLTGYAKGHLVELYPGNKTEFNPEFMPYYFPAGTVKVDLDTETALTKRFSEMKDVFSNQDMNSVPIENIFNDSYYATETLMNSVNSFGIVFDDCTRNVGTGGSLEDNSSDAIDIVRDLRESDFLDELIPKVMETLNTRRDHNLKKIVKSIQRDLRIRPLNENRDFSQDEIRDFLNLPHTKMTVYGNYWGYPEQIIGAQEKTLTQTRRSGSLVIKDLASKADISADVLTGSELKNVVGYFSIPILQSREYSVLRFSWDREIKNSEDTTVQTRYAKVRREAVSYKSWKNVEIVVEYARLANPDKLNNNNRNYKTIIGDFGINIPGEVKEWSEWSEPVYGPFHDYSTGNNVTTANVDFYVATDVNEFDKQNFNSIAFYNVDSHSNAQYPSFLATPVTINTRGLFQFEDDITIGGSGFGSSYGTNKKLSREASVIDGRYTLLSRNGDIRLKGDIVYNDIIRDETFLNYLKNYSTPFSPDYDPNTAARNVDLRDMLNLVTTNGDIVIPYANTYGEIEKLKNIKILSNIFAFGSGNRGRIDIEGYSSYRQNMGYRNILGTMVCKEAGPAGSGGSGFRSRNYYDERLLSNESLPFGTPESNLLIGIGVSFR